MRVVRTVLVVAIAALVASFALAQDKPKKKPGMPDPLAGQLQMLKGLQLTDDQEAKIKELRKQFGPKFAEAWKAREGILTDEQRKARAEAFKAAKDAGKKGKELLQAVQEALKLTDEQKTKVAEADKRLEELNKELRERIREILTPEQREQLKKRLEEGRRKAK